MLKVLLNILVVIVQGISLESKHFLAFIVNDRVVDLLVVRNQMSNAIHVV